MTKTQRQLKKLFEEAKHAAEKKGAQFVSLKEFARSLKGDDKQLAEQWLEHKSGALDKLAQEDRWERKGKMLVEVRLATKAAKRKTKSGGGQQQKK